MLDSPYIHWVEQSGFAHPQTVIHLFVGGSELHGAKVGSTDDLDLYGVYLETPEQALGLLPTSHFVWSTAPDERRNGPEDVDLTLYSLRRWAALAAKGNATALHFLFSEATAVSAEPWSAIQSARELFLSRRSAEQFLGFAENQRKRILNEGGRGKHGRRPEYECAHGYDSKAAMHCLRLLFECIELMRDHTLTLPRPERDLLIDVRQGAWSLARLEQEYGALLREATEAARVTTLPDEVDRNAISALLAKVHLKAWQP